MKAILLLATIVAVLHAKSYKMETLSSGSFIARLIKANQYHKYLNEKALYRAQVLKNGIQPILDYYDVIYTANITVGTPGQNVSVVPDTGSSNLWVVSSTCEAAPCNGYLSFYTRRKFNETKSSTFFSGNRTVTIKYSGGWYHGNVTKDTVSIAGMTIESQDLVTATSFADDFGYMPTDGILGLAWSSVSAGNMTSPIENLLPTLGAPLFTVWLDRKLNISYGGSGGLITYGEIDSINCDTKINYVPLSSQISWQFSMSGFSIGEYSERNMENVISDTGSSWFGVSSRIMNAVVLVTGANYDTEQNIYTVNCSTIMTQPYLEFTINDVEYEVPSEEYVLDMSLDDAKCVLAFFTIDSAGFGPAWIFGHPWTRSYCNVYDLGQKRIGFAKSKHSGSSGNKSLY